MSSERIVTATRGTVGSARETLVAYDPHRSNYPGGDDSAVVGKVSDGRLFSFTDKLWMSLGIISSRVVLILGQKNHRKTTTAMNLATVLSCNRMPDGSYPHVYADGIRMKGTQMEYDPLAYLLDSVPVELRERLNPFDDEFSFTFGQHETNALGLIQSSKEGIPATSEQEYLLRVSLHIMFKAFGRTKGIEVLAKIVQTLSVLDIKEYENDTLDAAIRDIAEQVSEEEKTAAQAEIDQLLARGMVEVPVETSLSEDGEEEPEDVQTKLVSIHELRNDETKLGEATQELSRIITRVLFGDFDQRFGGQKSFAKLMSQRAVVFNMSGMSDQTMAFIQGFIWRLKHEAHRRGDKRFIFQVQIHDENYKLWNDPVFAREMSDYLKQIRSYDTTLIMVSHRMRDYFSVGTKDSPERQKATNMFGDIPIWFVGKLAESDAQDVINYHNLDPTWRDVITTLQPGVFLALIGDWDPFTVDFNAFTTDQLLEISYSNMANDEALAATT